MYNTHQNAVVEFKANSAQVVFTAPSGQVKTVPSFLKGDGCSYVRYASAETGIHTYADGDCGGELTVIPYAGENPLYRHGAVRRAAGKCYLEHADGTPFFYLADTWWMGFTTRLPFPEGFAELTADRVRKGFTAVQIVAGLYPDMDPFDPRGKNEAGYPWDESFEHLLPAYFDAADKKIAYLVENGIAPVIVGCWGYYVDWAGFDVIRRHWEHLIARWAAYPVLWCIAGEATMPYYNNADILSGRTTREEYIVRIRAEWTKMAAHVRAADPFGRLVTIHPTQNGHEQVDDETLLDLDMLQTGHSGSSSLLPTLVQVKAAVDRRVMPVINSEVCYEGIAGSSYCDVQRYLFLSNVLTGCCGHTYGANGIWQLNSRDVPYGPSPHGASWGDTPWEDAYKLAGSEHIGNCKRFLMQLPWWRFERHPEWTRTPCTYASVDGIFSAGIPGEVRVFFKPFLGGSFWCEDDVLDLDGAYSAYYFDPIRDRVIDLGIAQPDENGVWRSPRVDAFQDWVLVLTKKAL